MEFISDSSRLTKKFKELCSQYDNYCWAVAWAGAPASFDIGKLLKKNQKKIDKLVIGLHFYQTSPEFIRLFMSNKNVKFLQQTDGTYHPKVYLFYNSNKEWAAIVGSSNFTQPGFGENSEASIYLDNSDKGVTYGQIHKYVDNLWKAAKNYDAKLLEEYNKVYKFQRGKIASLKKSVNKGGDSLPSELELRTWNEYYEIVLKRDAFRVDSRLKLLKSARALFESTPSYNNMDEISRKAIAGIVRYTDKKNRPFDWWLFGSMQGSRTFTNILPYDKAIGRALDQIPLSGEVTKVQFMKYRKAFSEWKNPIACATRLLAIKRPDLFVCIDSKNKAQLSVLLGIPKSRFTLDNYWNILEDHIWSSAWFRETPENADGKEADVKKAQVAMLDSLSYEG